MVQSSSSRAWTLRRSRAAHIASAISSSADALSQSRPLRPAVRRSRSVSRRGAGGRRRHALLRRLQWRQRVAGVAVAIVRVGAVGHLVQHRFRVGPQPGERPQQAAEEQRQQAQRLDRVELRMAAFLGDLLRQDVHQPEHGDQHDRRRSAARSRRRRWRRCPASRRSAARHARRGGERDHVSGRRAGGRRRGVRLESAEASGHGLLPRLGGTFPQPALLHRAEDRVDQRFVVHRLGQVGVGTAGERARAVSGMSLPVSTTTGIASF